MRRLAYLFPIVCAPLLGSCIFLLDYDDLKKGNATAGTSAGGALDEGGTNGVEAGGAGALCGDCDDHDPCTDDSCDGSACVHEATEGLKLDGFDTTLTAEQHVRVSLVGSGQLFYLAELEINKTNPKVALYRLAIDGTALEPIGTDLALDGNPVSNVGLAIEELPLGEVALHGFIATKLKLPSAVPRVFHVEYRNDKTTSTLIVGATYKADNPTVFPQALAFGGKIAGAWIQADGTIAVHDVGTAKTDTFGATTLPATTLSLLATSDNEPAVMFTAQAAAKAALGTYVETAGQNRAKVAECETLPGDYVSSSVISTQIPGLWLGNITRAGDYLTTGSATLLCAKNACTAVGEDCKKATFPNGIRDTAGATVDLPNDAPGTVYSVIALPQVAPKADDPNAVEGKLSLALGKADFSSETSAKSTTIGGDPDTGLMEVAHTDTSEALNFAGPDWPAVAILPSQEVAVTWIQPSQSASGTELHVQRYKMCLPTP